MSQTADPTPGAFLTDGQFEELAQGRLSPEALTRLRAEVQAALDDPEDAVDHDVVWSRLELRMKRAVSRAA